MVFRASGTRVFKLRVKDNAGHSATLSTGTDDPFVAEDVERMVKGFRAQRKWAWLALLAMKRVKLPLAYDNFVLGTIDGFMAAMVSEASDADLDPLVTAWEEGGADAKYVTQVRLMIPKGERFPLSRFRRAELKALLKKLPVGDETRRRYKAALSAFAKSLLDLELLESNPTIGIDLPKGKKSDKALKALNPVQAKKLILAQSGEQRAIEATMCGSGVEWQAIERLHRSDVDVEHRLIWAHGTKTEQYGEFRDRWVEVTEDWCWDILAAWVKDMLPDAQVFHRGERYALEVHDATSATLKIPRATLHQYRHTFAKMWISRGATGDMRPDGRNTQWLKNQLGHAPESVLLFTTYGVDIKAAKLTEKQKQRMGTSSATAPLKRVK